MGDGSRRDGGSLAAACGLERWWDCVRTREWMCMVAGAGAGAGAGEGAGGRQVATEVDAAEGSRELGQDRKPSKSRRSRTVAGRQDSCSKVAGQWQVKGIEIVIEVRYSAVWYGAVQCAKAAREMR